MVHTMGADSLIDSLSAIHPKGYDLSLDRIRVLLADLGDPQKHIPPPIHIAGTNGKGSVAAFNRAILEAAGKRVHVHTSPHLVRWHERFRIGQPGGGTLVSDAELEDAITRIAEVNDGRPITIFEILTAATFLLFSENPADYSIIEVGLGGRFDATNVIDDPLVSVITNVSLDHQAWLGDREELIAKEKAGIIKPGHPVVIGPQIDAVRGVLEETALDRGAPVMIAGQDFDFYEQAGRFVYQDGDGLLDLPLPRLRGVHQLANAATAIAALRTAGVRLSDAAYEDGMERVVWPGRMERLRPGALADLAPDNCEIWIDGGHNPSAGVVVASELAALEERASMPVFMICGMLTTKEPAGFFAAFEGLVERVFTVPLATSDSAVPPRELAEIAQTAGLSANASAGVADAFHAISGLLKDGEAARIIICGSLYLVGEVLKDNGTPPQ